MPVGFIELMGALFRVKNPSAPKKPVSEGVSEGSEIQILRSTDVDVDMLRSYGDGTGEGYPAWGTVEQV
jgi:hypothetical protein